jgi:hypothetical protein
MDHDRDVTEVWLVRHGETDHNATKTVQGNYYRSNLMRNLIIFIILWYYLLHVRKNI